MKVLVYRMGGLGDSILIYPVLEILTKKGYEVTVWGNTEYFHLAKISGFCKNTVYYAPRQEFDLKIFFTKNRELISKNERNNYFIDPLPPKGVWILDYYLKKLGLKGEKYSKTLKLNFNIKRNKKLCIIHPGSGSKRKNPEINLFFEIQSYLEKEGIATLYILGPAEKELKKIFKNFVYTENIVEATETLLKATLYIGTDSGLSHLSAYLGNPSLVIFGPTDPLVWHPIGEKVFIVRIESCPPCYPEVCEERNCLKTDLILEKTLACLRQIVPNIIH